MPKIICVVGDKGGTGKSAWARGFADFARGLDLCVALFDGDWRARSLFRVFGQRDEGGRMIPIPQQDPRLGCLPYDVRHRELGRDLLLNSMAVPRVDILLHDLPGGFRSDFAQVMSFLDPTVALREFVNAAAEMGFDAVFVTPITPNPTSHATALWLAETVHDRAATVAVLNRHYDDGLLAAWIGAEAKAFVEAGGLEIAMPGLDPATFLAIEQFAIRPSEALRNDRLRLADRLRLRAWHRLMAAEINRLAAVFGLPEAEPAPTPEPAPPPAKAVKAKGEPKSNGARQPVPPPPPPPPDEPAREPIARPNPPEMDLAEAPPPEPSPSIRATGRPQPKRAGAEESAAPRPAEAVDPTLAPPPSPTRPPPEFEVPPLAAAPVPPPVAEESAARSRKTRFPGFRLLNEKPLT